LAYAKKANEKLEKSDSEKDLIREILELKKELSKEKEGNEELRKVVE